MSRQLPCSVYQRSRWLKVSATTNQPDGDTASPRGSFNPASVGVPAASHGGRHRDAGTSSTNPSVRTSHRPWLLPAMSANGPASSTARRQVSSAPPLRYSPSLSRAQRSGPRQARSFTPARDRPTTRREPPSPTHTRDPSLHATIDFLAAAAVTGPASTRRQRPSWRRQRPSPPPAHTIWSVVTRSASRTLPAFRHCSPALSHRVPFRHRTQRSSPRRATEATLHPGDNRSPAGFASESSSMMLPSPRTTDAPRSSTATDRTRSVAISGIFPMSLVPAGDSSFGAIAAVPPR